MNLPRSVFLGGEVARVAVCHRRKPTVAVALSKFLFYKRSATDRGYPTMLYCLSYRTGEHQCNLCPCWVLGIYVEELLKSSPPLFPPHTKRQARFVFLIISEFVCFLLPVFVCLAFFNSWEGVFLGPPPFPPILLARPRPLFFIIGLALMKFVQTSG